MPITQICQQIWSHELWIQIQDKNKTQYICVKIHFEKVERIYQQRIFYEYEYLTIISVRIANYISYSES